MRGYLKMMLRMRVRSWKVDRRIEVKVFISVVNKLGGKTLP